ncbi:dihydropteroate synthase-like protein [Methanothermococcus sp. SCGC AD-155-C09]|nr:dihydropteroate synthase-like protein [Methanothermococcus sp. SCGC AD-155-C09]
MRILIITGKQAYNKVKEATKKYEYIDVHMANISIAAFLTPRMVIKEIKSLEKKINRPLSEIYDFILITGLVRHDLKIVEEESGIKCYKSTRESSDIPLLIDNLKNIKLSTKDYADDQIAKYLRMESENLIKKYEEMPLSKGDIKVGSLKIGDNYPMRVLGEIVHTPWLKDKELEKKITYYVESGVDMIDLGMVSNEDHSKDLKRIINIARDITDKPISIDTLNTKELIEGIKLDIDMILSVDGGNVEELLPYLKDGETVPVVLPTNYKLNNVPEGALERVNHLENNMRKLIENDIKVIGDLILEPINNSNCKFIESVMAYRLFRERNNIPMFFGVGNVSELFDADSNGVNALLAAIGSEVEGNILFTPEASSKCKFSIRELKIASKMMFLAKKRKSLPKDVGYNLINYKDKKFDEITTYNNYRDVLTISAKENSKVILDRNSFKIELDRENKLIVVICFDRRKNPKCIIKGRKAKEIYETLIRENLIGKMDHAAYMGMELQKAEIALRIGKKYLQDFELFYNEFWDI